VLTGQTDYRVAIADNADVKMTSKTASTNSTGLMTAKAVSVARQQLATMVMTAERL
jgi:hypothetical protein